jgi:hypothetical protein
MTAGQSALGLHFAHLRSLLRPGGNGNEHVSSDDSSTVTPIQGDRVASLAQRFGLSDFERDVLLLAAFTELEPGGVDLVSEAQGDVRLRKPTVALALSVLPNAHWSAFATDGPLRTFELIELEGRALTARTMSLPERVLHFLIGLDSPDEMLSLISRRIGVPETLSVTSQQIVEELDACLFQSGANGPQVVALCGPDPTEKAAVVAAAAARWNAPAYLLDVASVPTTSQDRTLIARCWSREAILSGAVLVLDVTETATPTEAQAVASLAGAIHGHVVMLVPEPVPVRHRPVLRLDLPRPTSAEQRDLWVAALGPLAERLNGTVQRVAEHFTLGSGAITTIGAEARRAERSVSDSRLSAAVWAACRRQSRPKLDELAQRIEGSASWEDIVLPAPQREMLRVLMAQVSHRGTVYERWGFRSKGARGLGINALFAGQSGTGKTLAAEILGNALDLDVYRIDLSSVVSKWIGETEKNLRRVFDAAEDGCAVLLFDEADALFGKRSEVKDSHDRYANIEVSYLLQRMEAYRGLAILTTNLKSHIDEAFLRRIRFIVEFPFPGLAERRMIWQGIFPVATPTEGLDLDRLAQLNIPGGSIRNIAVNAAFIAADAGQPVGMRHVLTAARAEYAKVGKPITDGELRGLREKPRG